MARVTLDYRKKDAVRSTVPNCPQVAMIHIAKVR